VTQQKQSKGGSGSAAASSSGVEIKIPDPPTNVFKKTDSKGEWDF
jgi:hypothetical protein